MHGGRPGREILVATVGFTALTVAATWPLAPNASHSLPNDLGDPLFVTWVMTWVARHLTAALHGDVGALVRMWDAPIFAPETGALAYSEHFTGQTLLALPLFWLGGSPIALYNVAFLASFVLSALAVHALVRVLTGDGVAAALAGVLYGFNVYRGASLSHLHTLTAQWPPFALAALVIFARTGSRRALVAAAAALVMTAWSSVYYLAFFAPVIALVAMVALVEHDAWRRRTSVGAMLVVAATSAVLIVPFLLPYAAVQRTFGIVRPRSEVELFSLTIDAYLASIWQIVPMLALAATALVWRGSTSAHRRFTAVFAIVAVLGFWLSLGPTPRFHGATFGLPGLYTWLLGLPGFSGLRVASRFAMVLMLGLSVLAGLGVAAIAERRRQVGLVIAAAGVMVQLGLYWQLPLPLDSPLGTGTLRDVPAYLSPAAPSAAIYDAVRRLEPSAVVVELPFGEPAYELRYMIAGLQHGHRILNGYSGVFPPSYRARVPALSAPWQAPAEAWTSLAPATYVLVHGDAWTPEQHALVERWLETRGATPQTRWNGASLWRLPVRP